jgi:hypothetical protein
MKEFLEIIFYDWAANWILSTASDNMINNILLDVPKNINYTAYNIIKNNPTKYDIEVYKSPKIININKYKEVIDYSLSNGRKLLIATNSTTIHKRISKIKGYNVVNLVGSNLETKLREYKDVDKIDEIDWNNTHIVIISSRYFAGFDIPLDVDILIDTNPHYSNSLISVNNIRQIIGRPRINVGRITLFICFDKNTINPNILYLPTIQATNSSDIKNKIKLKISKIKKEEWFETTQDIINDYAYYCLIFQDLLKDELKRYNCNIINYSNKKVANITELDSHQFYKKVEHLKNVSKIEDLQLDFFRIKKYLKYKLDGIFNPEMALLYHTMYLVKKNGIDIEIKKTLRPIRFYPSLFKELKGDWQWMLLYGWYKTELYKKNKKLPKHSELSKHNQDYLEARSLPTMEIVLQSNDSKDCYDKCLEVLKSKDIVISDREYQKLNSRCIDILNQRNKNDFRGLRTKEQLLTTIGYAHLMLLNGGVESYDFKLIRNRVYNPLSMIPEPLRNMMNINLVEIDIKHANPTFIDRLLGTNIADVVYETIMSKYQISRTEAKIKYNTYLNNHIADPRDVNKFFFTIGYADKALELTEYVVDKKGRVYDEMTRIEKEVVDYIATEFIPEKTPWFRFHDALIVLEEHFNPIKNSVKTKVMDIGLDFRYYNDSTLLHIEANNLDLWDLI